MNRITRSIALTGIVGSFALVACDRADSPRVDTDTNTTATTARTTADRSARGDQTTAVNQSNSSEHMDITARIRRAVMEDDALSTTAKNATIVTDNTGTVTLRGDVRSQAEKDAIASRAAAVVGAERVVNHLVVNP